MPALRVLGQRLTFLAGDDLRAVSKFVLVLRTAQVVVLIPTLALLLIVRTNFNDLMDDLSPTCVKDQRQKKTVVWSFWALSATTILVSIVLESFVFRISSRGSPVQVEERRGLPCLCAIKLIPLSVLRVVTVLLALYTLTILKDFCHPSAARLQECLPGDQNDARNSGDGQTKLELCPAFTVEAVSILAYTHVVEMSTAAVVLLTWSCRGMRAKQKQMHRWLRMTKWVSRHTAAAAAAAGSAIGGEAMLLLRSGSRWHCFCRWCCACTSCCTCCLFGGPEVVRSSTGGRQSSSLSDISIVLADYFDTGPVGKLDVTPSDLLVGLTVLGSEQRIRKEDRFAQLQAEMEESLNRDEHCGKDPEASEGVEVFLNCGVDVDIEDGTQAVVFVKSFARGTFDGLKQDEETGGSSGENGGGRRAFMLDPNSVQDLQLYRTNTNSRTYFKKGTRTRLKKENDIDRCIILEGAHYMRLAMAVYGHMKYLLDHTCTAPCCLAAGFLTCRGSCCCKIAKGDGSDPVVVVGDNLCGCNELAFLHLAGLDHEDLAYVSFKTGIQICPYGIIVDRAKKTVVIAIRGTFSLEATVADLNIRPELIDDYSDKCEALNDSTLQGQYCHSGMLHCALHIFEDLERHKILDSLLLGESPRLPGFKVVITGHSLGAGISSILSLMLRNKFHGLRCLCFAPPGCVMSEQASAQDFITSYVLDSDIVPRMSLHSVVGLRNDVLEMIARIKVPKHVALAKDRMKRKENGNLDLVHRRESIPESTYYQRLREFNKHQEKLKKDRGVNDIKLYPPGTLVHLVENLLGRGKSSFFEQRQSATYTPVWAERDDFAEIQVTKSLLTDHDPERILKNLTIIAESFH